MPKFNTADIVEFIPGNYEFSDPAGVFWLEGAGLILDIEDGNYVVQIFHLQKISTKNFATYDIGQTILRLPIKEADSQNCFRSLEL